MNWIGIIISILKVVTVLVAIFIVFVTLLQRPKNEGLGAAFGGDTANNIFGAQTTNVLVTLTRWLCGIFLSVCFIISILGSIDPDRRTKVNEYLAAEKAKKAERDKQEEAKRAAEEAAAKAKAAEEAAKQAQPATTTPPVSGDSATKPGEAPKPVEQLPVTPAPEAKSTEPAPAAPTPAQPAPSAPTESKPATPAPQ
jgi:preprotein translocase subunit SecG